MRLAKAVRQPSAASRIPEPLPPKRGDSAKMPRDNAERVVTGAKNLSPFLGGRMAATRMLDKAVFVRELLPQDLKLEIRASVAGRKP